MFPDLPLESGESGLEKVPNPTAPPPLCLSAGDLRELYRVPLRGEGSCGGGGALRDSIGSGATEEGQGQSQPCHTTTCQGSCGLPCTPWTEA